MKKLGYIFGIAAIALSLAACTSKEQNYTPTPAYPGDNVYFPSTINPTVALGQGATSFSVTIARNESVAKDAIDVPIISAGDAIDGGYISVPGTVSFAAGETEAAINIAVDPEKLGLNNAVGVTLAIADEGATMPYGDSSITLSISIPLPWKVFDTGVLTESPGWWGETENKTLYYQEISSDLWYCKLPQCWGHDTIAGGDSYDCQDYLFYWDKKTDFLYVCYCYMGFVDGGVPIHAGTKADYYIAHYFNTGDSTLSPDDVGTDEWFAAQNYYLNALYGPEDRPHYDGNGGFYLANSYICDQTMEGGAYEGYYETMDDDPDTFICDSFVRLDFTSTVEYGGMFVDPDGVATPIINFTGAADVAGLKYIIASQDIDPLTLLSVIVVGEDENIQDITLVGGKATVQPALEAGTYRIVAVPYGADGELQPDDAVLCDFYFPGVSGEKPEVEGLALVLPPSAVFTPEYIAQKGYTDYSNICCAFAGVDIKSGKWLFNTSATLSKYADVLEPLLEANGDDFTDSNLADINSEYGCVYTFSGVPADTEFELICSMTNKYGSYKFFDVKGSTASAPAKASLNTLAKNLNGDYSECVCRDSVSLDWTKGWGTVSKKVKGNGKKSTGISKFEAEF